MPAVNSYRDFSFASQENYPIISNIEFLLEPQIVKDLFNVNPLDTDIGDFMAMGLMEKVEGEEIIHREKRSMIDAPFLNQSTTVTDVFGTASVPNGDPAAFAGYQYVQLSPGSHTPTSGDFANQKSAPRVGETIEFNNQAFWRIQGKRENIANAHRLYITPYLTSNPSLAATITNVGGNIGGDQITIPSANYEEASWGMQSGKLPTFKVFRSYISTFADMYETTDKQLNNKTYPIVDPRNGQTINFWYEIGTRDTEESFMLKEALGLFLVPKADASAVAYDPISGTNKSLTTTDGYLRVLDATAPHKQYDDNISLAFYNDLCRLRNRLNQTKDCQLWHGMEYGNLISDLITKVGVNGSIVYDREDLKMNFKRLELPNGNFDHKNLRILNHPKYTNIPGRPYPWLFIIKPTDKTQDAKTGIPMDAFTIMYKQQHGGGARGHYKVWMTGGLAPTPTSSQRVRRIDYNSEKGIRIVGAEKHIYGESASF